MTDCVVVLQRLFTCPYLELFARNERAGWDCWGDQIPEPAPCLTSTST